MERSKILIADSSEEYGYALVQALETANLEGELVFDGDEALSKIAEINPDMIISENRLSKINGFELLKKVRINSPSSTFIFLTSDENTENRLQSLKLGAKDYIYKSTSIDEIVARIKMIMRRTTTHKASQIGNKLIGKLDEINLRDLIQSFGIEKKSGKMNIFSYSRRGEIHFYKGSIDRAVTGNFEDEDALHKILFLVSGNFVMNFEEIAPTGEFGISTVGALIEWDRNRTQIEKLVSNLPVGEDAIFKISEKLKLALLDKRTPEEAKKFIQLFDGKSPLDSIVYRSDYDNLTALDKIVRLYKENLLVQLPTTKVRKRRKEVFFTPEELELFREKVYRDFKDGKMLIIGTATSGKTEMIKVISGVGIGASEETKRALDFAKVTLGAGLSLSLFGISVERQFADLMEKLTSGMLGYIFLMDAMKPESFEFTGYILNSFISQYDVPWAVAITNTDKPGALSYEEVVQQIHLPVERKIFECNPTDKLSVKKLLLSMEVQLREEIDVSQLM